MGNRQTRTISGALSSLITAQTFTGQYDANNRLAGQDTYDANGNTVAADVRGIGAVTDAYTFDNRLKERTNPDGSKVRLAYDGDGNRVAETVIPAGGGTSTTTWFLIDTMNPTGYAQTLEETQGGAVTKRYLIGLDVIAQQTTGMGGRVLFFGYDGHGSVRYLSDTNGNLVGARDYDAFGVHLANDGMGGGLAVSFTECRLGFAGEEFVPALGQYYNRARIYSEDTGRFWTMDTVEGSIRDPQTLNLYAYCGNDPVNRFDYSGHEWNLPSIGAAVTIGVNFVVRIARPAIRFLSKAKQFFWNNRTYNAVRKAYWKANGPANGRSLHHWLIPQRWSRVPQGIRNAGFNLLELPPIINTSVGGLNQWMGFVVRSGGWKAVVAVTVENGIRIAIPLSLASGPIIVAASSGGTPPPPPPPVDPPPSNPIDLSELEKDADVEVQQIELQPSDWENYQGFEELKDIDPEEDDEMTLAPPPGGP